MNTCMAFKTDGVRCNRGHNPNNTILPLTIPDHLRFCGMHQGVYRTRFQANMEIHHQPGMCLSPVGPRGWCQHPAGETGKCVHHHAQDTARIQRDEAHRRAERRLNEALAFFENRQPRPTWREVANEVLAPNAPEVIRNEDVVPSVIIGAYYRAHRGGDEPFWWAGGRTNVANYELWLRAGGVGPEPQAVVVPPPPVVPPANVLAALAHDTQNVHRTVVSEQTNHNTALILATPDVPEHCRAHELLAVIWLNLRIASWSHVRRTVDDIYAWRAKDTCRAAGDRLYRRVLHSLFMRIYRITDEGLRKELWKRLYEECDEAVGLCCEGHISRLCNVLVGFEDSFKPPIPFGEIVQSKMSAIAAMDMELDGKVKLAMEFFDEHNVPQEERMAWLDAF